MLQLNQHTVLAIVNITNILKDYQDAKFEATASRNLLYYEYKSYDGTSTYLYTFLCCSSSILCKNSNCMLRIVKKGGVIGKKIGTLVVSS